MITAELAKLNFKYQPHIDLLKEKINEVTTFQRPIENLHLEQNLAADLTINDVLKLHTDKLKLKAYINADIPLRFGEILKAKDIKKFLTDKGIDSGAVTDKMNDIAELLNENRGKPVTNILAAHGTPPVESAAGKLLLHKSFTKIIRHREIIETAAPVQKSGLFGKFGKKETGIQKKEIFRIEKRTDILLPEKSRIAKVIMPVKAAKGTDVFGADIQPLRTEKYKIPQLVFDDQIAVQKNENEITYINLVEGYGRIIDGKTLDIIPKVDGQCSVTVSKDMQKVRVSFVPANEAGDKITIETAEKELAARGIKNYDKELIQNSLEKINSGSLSEIYNITVKTGTMPVHGKDGYIEKVFTQQAQKSIAGDSSARVDYREFNSIREIAENTLIARVMPPEPPVSDGINVLDQIIPGMPGKPCAVKLGKNTALREETGEIYSTVSGVIKEEPDGTPFVEALLVIEKNVSYETGNIRFNGDIEIKGDICDGFTVESEGDITVSGSVGAAKIKAGKNITIEGAIKGRGKAKIRAAESITVKFAENALLECEGNFSAAKYIFNCIVKTLGTLTIGTDSAPGSLIASTVVVYKNIVCAFIGKNNITRASKIYCGYHYRNFADYITLGHEKNDLIHRHHALTQTNAEPLRIDEILQQIKTVTEKINHIASGMYNAEMNAVKVTIQKQLFPPLVCVFSGEEYKIEEPAAASEISVGQNGLNIVQIK